MRFLSLFSGIGGFDLAFERAGMVCDSMVEIDKNCQNILRRHFPNSKLYDDVRKVGIATHERGSIELICGGFPCQDLSIAGKRAGLAGKRSGLWFEFARIIDELEPQRVVAENVPGLLSSGKGADFAVIIRWLAERGYGVAWRVLDAQYFGVPQRRRRVFIVGSLGDGRAAEVLFEREGVSGNTPQGGKAGEEVAKTLATGSNKGRNNPSDGETFAISGMAEYKEGVGTLRANGGDLGGGSEVLVASALSTSLGHHGWAIGDQDMNNLVPSLVSNGDAHSGFRDEKRLVTFVNTANSGSNQNNAKQSNIMDTLDTLASVAVQQQTGVRRLTPTECERLQGFPDDWTDGQSDSVRYRQLGNAVAVPVVEWIGKRMAGAV